MEICPKCGLPKEACVCEEIAKKEQRIKIETVKRSFGKIMTVISGIKDPHINMKETAKVLKQRLACGGTVKNDTIELQGDHRKKVKDLLIELGFAAESIE